ncbi:MAG: hypothetical protein IT424_02275 [Pirellulales bacterium]|nr:hypothetical protein [Pirellulales bacterium]
MFGRCRNGTVDACALQHRDARRTPAPGRRATWALGALVCGLGGATGWSIERDGEPSQRPPLPSQLLPREDFASSSACQECHADQYASWRRTYHRTMTQVASSENLVGRFDGSSINSNGLSYRVFKRGDEFWAAMPDPDEMIDRQRRYELSRNQGQPVQPPQWSGLPTVDRRVVMSTGSHRYQTYWVESHRYPGTLMTLPLVYLIAEGRWIPREAAFMTPPGAPRMVTVWNDHCINCHSTGPAPRPFEKHEGSTRRIAQTGFHSHVAEIGIACEACHGPAEEHVRLRRLEAAGDATAIESLAKHDAIVHPGRLDHRRASEICGQCHGVYIRTGRQGELYRDEGQDYRPGDELQTKRNYIFPPQDREFYSSAAARAEAMRDFGNNLSFFRERFWDSGHILAGGREYTALAVTACYRRGEISCLDCHSMHDSDPSDQLRPHMSTNAACVRCHDAPRFTAALTEHTRHAPASSGSHCLNCHMPHTTYALFSAIRSHQIDSPDVARSVEHGTPNACNLCHLDKTLAWTQDALQKWYGKPPLPLDVEQARISAALVWLLKGNAAQRAIAAWHFGWKPAQDASGTDWPAPFVAELLADSYGVVRYIALRSLKTLPGYEGWSADFMDPPNRRAAAAHDAAAAWARRRSAPLSRRGPEVLINAQDECSQEAVRWLLQHQDKRPVTIKE